MTAAPALSVGVIIMPADRGASLPAVTVGFGYRRQARPEEIAALEAAGVRRILLAVDGLPYDETVESLGEPAGGVEPWLRR